ncbi:DUF6746 family protein [Pseudidiomarina woesei]|uniref:Soluble cytochrome b562 n=1 Tax=Pseudidiomarina woesei TaxID=1381080 RepID=A0A0K6GUU5_9GAMM|nr:DUF6746 family protein [Pseudidiomarina woesei]CUA82502.1 hypothetical protein Ga0061064_0068 [Pseudidiomarina woesei]
MKKLSVISAALALVLVAAPSYASDDKRPDHFKGKKSETLQQALDNMREYNKKLEELMHGELTPQKMAEIHQLTYTLEEALQKLDDEVDDLQEVLEEVHLGSEHMDFGKVKSNGRKYLENSGKIVK